MTDPRYIFEVTGQMRQYGPVGIRLPDGPGQTDATLYFKSREEAEEYMREHPVEATLRTKSCQACGRAWGYCACLKPQYREVEIPVQREPPIPPTSAPWREGGYAPPTGK